LYHSILGSRVIQEKKKKKKVEGFGLKVGGVRLVGICTDGTCCRM
jgi:hypothetical protein